MRVFRHRHIVGLALTTAIVAACSSGGGRTNPLPTLGAPTGPGTPTGADPDYSSTVTVGDSLLLDITATDPSAQAVVTVTATETGGSLTAAQAGFTTPLPATVSGSSPQTLLLDGVAAMAGDIVLTFAADDGRPAADTITLTITILPGNSPPQVGTPTGPGTVGGADPAYVATVPAGGSLAFDVTATDVDATDTIFFTASVTGGSLTAVQAGFLQTFPLTTSGSSPVTIPLSGLALTAGDIEITFSADDGQGGVDAITHTITVGNDAPRLRRPTGPGTVTGTHPTYASRIGLGDPLDFDVTATDPNLADTLTLTATVTGGTLGAAQAGFTTTFPAVATGTSPQILPLAGTSLNEGDIEITVDVDDGHGGTDTLTHTITIANDPPQISIPTGPGTVTGSRPAYSSGVVVGDPLDFDVTATDPNLADTLTLTATVTGGTITAAQAGFTTAFPAAAVGPSPDTLSLAGTALMEGEIEITFDVDDGHGATDTITHWIRIFPPGPEVLGFARYSDENRNAVADAGDLIIVRFSEDVTVTGAVATDLALPVMGDSFGTGAIVTAGPGFDEVTITLGTSPILRSRGPFDTAEMLANAASGIDVNPRIAADVIESTSTGADAVPSMPADLIPIFVDSLKSLGSSYSVGVAAADLDADGDIDIVDTDILGGGTRIWENDGAGNFTDTGQSLGASQTTAAAIGDVDRDGDPDIVTASSGAGGNLVWENDGLGGFTGSGQSLGTWDTQDLELGDVDHDGDLDIVTGNGSGQGNRVWMNDGTGGFTDSTQSLGVGETWSIALGDVDRDGHLDIVSGNDASQGNRVWINDGVGNFTDSNQSIGLEETRAVALGDVDRDGDLDLVYGNVIDPGELWWNDGAGNFTDSGRVLGGGGMTALVLADIDGDSALDLLGAAGLANGSRAWMNDGLGNLAESGQIIGLANTTALEVADVDRDGDLDLIEGIDGGNRIWSGSLSGTWGTATVVDSGQTLGTAAAYGAAIGDVDRDGDNDVVLAVQSGGNQVWRNIGGGVFTDTGQSLGTSNTWAVALGDVDRDGDLDIVSGNRSLTENRVWTNDGAGNFTDSGQALGGSDTAALALGDLDRDGYLDFISGNSVLSPDLVWLNNGSGLFTDSGQLIGGDTTTHVSLGDVDADGDLDYVSTHSAGGSGPVQIRLWINDGSANLSDSGQPFGGSIRYSSSVADVDRDGDLDIAAGGSGGNTFWWNDGTGLFTDSGQAVGGSTTFETLLGDLDGDGDLDVFYANVGGSANQVFLNDGTGTFLSTGWSLGSSATYGATMGDLDGDGDLDVVTANAGSDPNRIFLNE